MWHRAFERMQHFFTDVALLADDDPVGPENSPRS
jgi:hypothetical protein